MRFQHIRHATHLLEYAGRRILVDPVLSPAGAMPPIPGAPNQSPNPLVPLPVPAKQLADSDLTIVTHLHGDHFDPAAAEQLDKRTPILCASHDGPALKEAGFTQVTQTEDLVTILGITFVRIGGTHGTGPSAAELNPVSGYVLKAPGEPVVYITGDTVWCPEVETALAVHQPDVVICYGGTALYKGDTITMGTGDFEHIRRTCPEATLVILHLEGWNHCGLSRADVRRWISETKQEPMVRVPENGEAFLFG